MNFREFLEQNTVGPHNDTSYGAFVPSQGMSGPMGGFKLAGSELIPTISRTSPIKFIERNKNPIFIMLADGTRIYLNWDEFKRVKNEPKVGKLMTVVFQRFPGDTTESTSQISSIQVQ